MLRVLTTSLILVAFYSGENRASAQDAAIARPRSWNLLQPQPSASDEEERVGSSRDRRAIIDALPLDRLTPDARAAILGIVEKPTMFRRLPTEMIRCDQEMFLFLARNPDVLVSLWDLMGITKVQTHRLDPYRIEASDGMGTLCNVDLVYGDPHLHIFSCSGSYEGKLLPGKIYGKGVFVLHSSYTTSADGETTVSGTLDCFVQLDSLGMDLIVRTISPIIGRSADSNYEQTARFIAQVNEASVRNPPAMLDVSQRLPQVTSSQKVAFADTIVTVARRHETLAVNVRDDDFQTR